ncbi:LuxR C-terminal-related transcriptional regulator [Microbacterium gorillae]|uniref:LuxR C-terminal-related transcriptional regulator n=1 Tax=Microbacterium gorillae TaxID=1231063 RepID=UPI00058ADD50|nr:LuxR C-terminal-related transcriptional regulator [Microbacterium gorillae]
MNSPAQPSEDALVAHAVSELARRTNFPVAFGGLFESGEVHITAIHGARTRSLSGLRVLPEHGLGGRAVVELRPRMTNDYGSSTVITHDYDEAVLGEGISTLLAVPVIVGGVARGVLYGGAWNNQPIRNVAAAPAFQVADALAGELRMRDEVDRRVAMIAHTAPIPQVEATPSMTGAQQEALRDAYASLRRIAADASDPDMRGRLGEVEHMLVLLAGDAQAAEREDVRLAPREVDVLACAALGGTNADIARQLGLKPGTVKAYLGSAMSKLGVSTRIAAVTRARRAGLIP